MRILWLSPWLRPLARIHGEQLRAAGDDVLLITTDAHPQRTTRRDWEIVTDPRPKSPASWPEFTRVYHRARRFGPDVVVTELVRDPRWILLGALAPRVDLVHDDQPHGPDEARPRWEESLFTRWGRSAARTVCFSDHVASRVAASRPNGVRVVPLTSDVPDTDLAPPAMARDRRDFVLLGRLNEYKNLPVVFAAWLRHAAGPGYRGDTLRLYGSASSMPPLPDAVQWNGGAYDADAIRCSLQHAKGSLVHYRVASQSGVQVLSMQAGVAPIISTVGALPEFAGRLPRPVGVDDVAGVTSAFDQLADPDTAAELGAQAAAHYRDHYSAAVATPRLRAVLADVRRSDERHR